MNQEAVWYWYVELNIKRELQICPAFILHIFFIKLLTSCLFIYLGNLHLTNKSQCLKPFSLLLICGWSYVSEQLFGLFFWQEGLPFLIPKIAFIYKIFWFFNSGPSMLCWYASACSAFFFIFAGSLQFSYVRGFLSWWWHCYSFHQGEFHGLDKSDSNYTKRALSSSTPPQLD